MVVDEVLVLNLYDVFEWRGDAYDVFEWRGDAYKTVDWRADAYDLLGGGVTPTAPLFSSLRVSLRPFAIEPENSS